MAYVVESIEHVKGMEHVKSMECFEGRECFKGRERFEEIECLGVGLNYQPKYEEFIALHRHLVDFTEISPDILCRNIFDGYQHSMQINPDRMSSFQNTVENLPVLVHGLNLSIGSATGMNEQYLSTLEEFSKAQKFHWHSEHLGFMGVMADSGEYLHAGTQLPIPFSQDVISMLVPRSKTIQQRFQCPFLLENTAYYLEGIHSLNVMDEIEFLNRLCDQSGCGLLLDLYNLYCNASNFGFDPIEALTRLNLDNVVEVHIAGGNVQGGYLVDVHSDHTPSVVWEMLDYVLCNAKNLKAVVYELLEQAHNIVGDEGIAYELAKAKKYWNNTSGVRMEDKKI